MKPYKVSRVLECVIQNQPLENKQKNQLLEVAERLFMRYGLKSVSMDDIALDMGASKKTLYQLVASKEDLVEDIMAVIRQRDNCVLEQSAHESADAIDEFLRNSRHFIQEMRKVSPITLYDLKKYYSNIWKSQMQGHMNDFVLCIGQNISRGMKEGLYRSDLQAHIIARLYGATVMAVTDTELFPAKEVSIDQIITHHAIYHLNGIVNEKGRQLLQTYLQNEELG